MEIVTTPSTRASALRAPTALPCLPAWSGGEPLPQRLRYILECLSGYDLSDVRVYPDSHWPARLGARAFAHGSDIHLSPGAEDALEHEAWHVVQQKQGRARATGTARFGGVALNDEAALEREADMMGLMVRSLVLQGQVVSVTRPLRIAPVQRPVLQRQVSVLGVEYDNLGRFQEELKNRLFLTGFNVVDLADIATDLLRERRVFAQWADVKREILIREVGYQAVAQMRKLALANGVKAERAARRLRTELAAIANPSPRQKKQLTEQIFQEAPYIRWGNAAYHNYGCKDRPMFRWMQGVTNEEPLLMNCWEAVLYSLVKTGLVHRSYLTWCNQPDPAKNSDMPDLSNPNNLAASILRNMDGFFWPTASACNLVRKDKQIPPGVTTRSSSISIPADMVIPKGRVLMFSKCLHVALSTGTLRNGKHGILELDGGTQTIQESTIEDLGGTYLTSMVIAPFPTCPAGSARIAEPDPEKKSKEKKVWNSIDKKYAAKKDAVQSQANKQIEQYEKQKEVPGNLQFEGDINALIEAEKKLCRQQCEKLDADANAEYARAMKKWSSARTSTPEILTLQYQACDPYEGEVVLL